MTSFYKWPPESGHDFLLATQEVLREFQSLGMPHPPFFLFFLFLFERKKKKDRVPKGQKHNLFILININVQTAHYFIL